jgi:hypothetical protein
MDRLTMLRFRRIGGFILSQEKTRSKNPQVSFRSGETVPVSGVWRPAHEGCGSAPELWVREQDAFPPCPRCGRPASFTLLEQVHHISEDPDFQ